MRTAIGVRHDRLVVLAIPEKRKYLVRCDCGTEKMIDARNLYKTSSCGCYQKVSGSITT